MRLESKKALSAIAAVLFSTCSLQVSAVDSTVEQKVDKIFADWQANEPGCSVDVTRHGKPVFTKGYGLANMEYDIANSEKSVFRIASTSKQFTATAVALLAEQGRLSLDDSLRKHFPEFPAYADKITITQLVHHTSGIRDYLALSYLANWDEDFSDQEVLDLLFAQNGLNFEPGSEFLYSNSGYLLLAHLVKRVSGKTLRQYSEEHIFKPLGMTSTHFHDDHTEIVPNRASGYGKNGKTGKFKVDMTILDMVGDGGVYTTTEDMRKWHANFISNQLGKKDPELIKLLTTPAVLNDGEKTDYAFGLMADDKGGTKTLDHGGAFVGYRAHNMMVPEYGYAFSLLCNRADARTRGKINALFDVFLGDKVQSDGQVKTDNQKSQGDYQVDAQVLAQYAGAYWDGEEQSSVDILLEQGKLYYFISKRAKFEMAPVAKDRFILKGLPPGYSLVFSGNKDKLEATYQSGRQINYDRFERTIASAEQLAKFHGEFYSPELDVTWQVTNKDGKLVMIDSAADIMPLRQEKPGMFTFQAGTVSFALNDKQQPEFLLQSGRVKNLKFVKVAQ